MLGVKTTHRLYKARKKWAGSVVEVESALLNGSFYLVFGCDAVSSYDA